MNYRAQDESSHLSRRPHSNVVLKKDGTSQAPTIITFLSACCYYQRHVPSLTW